MISDMKVLAKTTRENGLHARPSQIRPVPPMRQLTKEKPVFSSPDARPCAVTVPSIVFSPAATGLAIDIIWQL
ncbi:hypothetical protein B296_00039112 [Ensete ventricosum]|uniref:Uncharacterized protein n=1 Tax=Ensete ventricosum TaxID=4639 RepID=A0A426YSG1_ENSVE|nr:hypothetical protein B296_00039112 [Ensete ventricosum]